MHILGRAAHLLFQLFEHVVGVAFEEAHQLAQRGTIVFALLCADAGAAAQFDVIVEAGARVLPRDFAVTVQVRENTAQGVERMVTGAAGGIGAKVAGAVLAHAPHHLHFGEIVLPVHLDIGKTLVVLKADVIARLKTFDQLIFEDQRLQLGIRHPPGNIGDLIHQRLSFGVVVG